MSKELYRIRATCENSRCATTVFEAERREIWRMSTGGRPYEIDKIVCPACRMWAPITAIREITS